MAGRFARILAVLTLAVAGAPAAHAMGDGWSFEVAVGQATFNVSADELAFLPDQLFSQVNIDYAADQTTLKRKDRSYTVITGYRFNRHLAMETGFFRAGAFQFASTGTVVNLSTPVPASFTYSFRAKGVVLGITSMYPLGEIFDVRGRVGLASTDTRVKYSATVQSTTLQDKYTSSSQDFYMGVGVGAVVGKYYRVGLDWLLFDNLGHSNREYRNLTYRADAENFLLSVAYLY